MPDPQQVQIPPVNTTVTVQGQAPPEIPTTPAPLATNLTLPPIGQNTTAIPALPPLPKESFREGFNAEGNPQFTTDAEGDVISTEPARRTGTGGILGRILVGALKGATNGMGAQVEPGSMGRGAAFSAAAKRAAEQRIAANDRARAIAQQDFANRQAARAAKIKQQLDLAQEAQITQNMEFAKEEHPGVLRAQKTQNEEAELRIKGLNQEILQNGINFRKAMADMGVDPTPFYSESDPAFRAHGYALAHGVEKMMHNGGSEDSNGVDIYNTQEMQNKVLDKPETWYSYDGALDKDGNPIPTPHVMSPDGKTTALDYFNAVLSGRAQMVQMQQRISAQMTLEQHKAAIAESQGKAAESQANARIANQEATNMEQNGSPSPKPAGFKLPDDVLSMSAPQLSDFLKSQGVKPRADFNTAWNIGHYFDNLSTYQAWGKGPKGISLSSGARAQMEQYITDFINPHFAPTNYDAMHKMITEYADTRPGHTGGNLVAFNTAISHLGQLNKAGKSLDNSDFRGWNMIKNELAEQIGEAPPIVFDAIRGALEGEVGKVFKGGPADIPEREKIDAITNWNASPAQLRGLITAFAKLMQSKSSVLVRTYGNEIGFLPPNAIDSETVQTLQNLGLNPYDGFPPGMQVMTGGTSNPNPTQPQINTSAGQAYLNKNSGQ